MASLIGRIEHKCASPLFRAASAPAFRAAYRTTATVAAVAQQHTPIGPIAGKHYVVIGAGLAGLATAYHLLVQSTTQGPVHVTVYDAVGIGAGGSRAAAGLLHPFAPMGKLLWRAHEAMEAAVELLAAAEAAAAQDPGLPDCIAWRTGMLKPATSSKQSQSFWKLYGSQHQHVSAESLGAAAGAGTQQQQLQALLTAAVLSSSAAQQLLPGVQLPSTKSGPAVLSGGPTAQVQCAANTEQDQQQAPKVRGQRQRQVEPRQPEQQLPPGWTPESSPALYLPGGITLQPLHYMRALWSASQHAAAARGDGSSIRLQIQQLQSLADVIQHNHTSSSALQQQQQQQGVGCDPLQRVQQGQLQHVDAIVVAAGAAVGSLAEIGEHLPIKLCQGYTLDMVPPPAAGTTMPAAQDAAAAAAETAAAAAAAGADASVGPPTAAGGVLYPAAGPSILGTPYLASQGGQVLVIGATKQYNCSTEQAVAELGTSIDPSILVAHHEQQQVVPAAAAGDCPASEGSQAVQAGDGQPRRWPSSAAATAAAAEGALSQGGAQLDKVAEVAAAAQELLSGAGATWPSIKHWSIAGIRSGVRALPPKSAQGAVPIAGRWTELQVTRHCEVQQTAAHQQATDRVPVWLLVGLGARGLLYHAWLGKLVAAAVVGNSEERLPAELLAWRQRSSPQQS